MPAASQPVPSPDRNHARNRIAFITPYFQGYRHSRRRLGSPWVGPINATLKRLKLATVTYGATSTLSTSSASLSLRRFVLTQSVKSCISTHKLYLLLGIRRDSPQASKIENRSVRPFLMAYQIRPTRGGRY